MQRPEQFTKCRIVIENPFTASQFLFQTVSWSKCRGGTPHRNYKHRISTREKRENNKNPSSKLKVSFHIQFFLLSAIITLCSKLSQIST